MIIIVIVAVVIVDIIFNFSFITIKRLLIASQYQPESILETFIPYIRGSRPIVIYHINKEVLTNACVYMRVKRKYLNPTITESWLRRYQVAMICIISGLID